MEANQFVTEEDFNNTHAMWMLIKTGHDDEVGEFELHLNVLDEIWFINESHQYLYLYRSRSK